MHKVSLNDISDILHKVFSNYSPFANGYLPMTYFVKINYKKLPIPLPIFYYLELVKVTVADGPVSVLSPSLSELPIRNSWAIISESDRILLPIFYYFELIREALANTL